MRNLSTSSWSGETKRGSTAGLGSNINQAHAKYKGLISTPGYCKFSAWKRETDIPKQPFSRLILASIASQAPDKLWLKDQTTGRSENFGDVCRKVENVAAGLAKLGLTEGSVVCLWASNYVEYWLVCLAVWELGASILPINCLTNTERLHEQLKQTSAAFLVCDSFNIEQGLNLKGQLETLKQVLLISEDPYDEVTTVQSLITSDAGGRVSSASSKFDWDRTPILLMFTTRNGECKVVKHTNKSLTAQVFSPKGTSNNWFDQNVGDSLLCATWFFHFPGLLCFSLCALQGVSLYFLSEYSDMELLAALADTHVPNVVLYPWQVRMMSQSSSLEMFDLSQLKVIVTGGSILGPTISKELLEKLPSLRFIRESYGLKEAGLLTYNYPKFDKSGPNSVPDDHLMPVGLPNMWTSFKIIDRVTHTPVTGPDLQGEICIKTCQLFSGYMEENAAQKLLDNEGYFHTGDMGYYDKDGIIHFVEQISSLISFWMYEVSPSVLESRLLSHSSVADAAVIGIDDKENGQLPRGFVVLKSGHEETEENLINFLESRLQDHERLRGGLFYIQNIPRDENWKVMKSVLKKFVPPLKFGDEQPAKNDNLQVEEQNKINGAHSPRTQRAVELAAQLLVPNEGQKDAEEIFGMKSRSRRGSKENILESSSAQETVPIGGVEEMIPDLENLKEDELTSIELGDCEEMMSYFLRISVDRGFLEKKLLTHPGVSEVVVRPVDVEAVGSVPRAYVVIKQGFELTAEELAGWANSRLEWRHRIRGGIVIVERLPRDSTGNLLVNLEQFDGAVAGAYCFTEKDKVKVTNTTSL